MHMDGRVEMVLCVRTCASISAHYSFSDVFDNLVISLCNFTGLAAAVEVGFVGS